MHITVFYDTEFNLEWYWGGNFKLDQFLCPSVRATLVTLSGKKDFVSSHGIEHIPAYKLLSRLGI